MDDDAHDRGRGAGTASRKPLPHPDRDSTPWWRALTEGRLQLQRCRSCGVLRWPPREPCHRCASLESDWVDVEGSGRIASWIRTHRAFAPGFAEELPYTTVQVALDADPALRMIGGWLGEREPHADEPVRMRLVDTGVDFRLPCWEPA